MEPSYAYVWEFNVSPENCAEFESHYGPSGTWAALFRQSSGYIGTELLRDSQVPGRYLTIDHWVDEASHAAFQASYASQYAELDEKLEHLSAKETPLGHFHACGA